MGRQIVFHALTGDLDEFVGFAEQRDSIVIGLRDADDAEIHDVQNPSSEARAMVLCNRSLGPVPERQRVTRTDGTAYYRVEDAAPVVEFSTSQMTTWEGAAALMQGRIYSPRPDLHSKGYSRWYGALERWIRKHFDRGPTTFGGYIGPEARQWFDRGGILLPMFKPVRDNTWLRLIASQEGRRKNT